MSGWLLLALVLVALVLLALRWLATVPAAELARAIRTFIAVFASLLGAGLAYAGRVGLALAALAAAVVALRSLWRARRPADPMEEDSGAQDAEPTRAVTDWLEMELDPASARVDGRVRRGRFAGSRLSALTLDELLTLREELGAQDPESVTLLEAYLDRRDPAWRARLHERARSEAAPGDAMDEATAYAILGLEPGASEEAIKAAHRRLMARIHPDHGGSEYLARQLNLARDVLLRARRAAGRAQR